MTLTGMSSGPTTGQKTTLLVTDIAAGTVSETVDASLVMGDNTFAVPAGASRVAITPPAGTAVVKVRTNLNSGDAGLQVAPYSGTPFVSFALVAGTTSVILNASATVAGVEISFI
jgi:hypothetical protein